MHMKLSVIVPSENNAKLVTLTLETLQEIRGREVEIIVVDNGSTDDVRSQTRLLLDTFIPLQTDINVSHEESIHHGVQAAHGEVVWIIEPGYTVDDVRDLFHHTLSEFNSSPSIVTAIIRSAELNRFKALLNYIYNTLHIGQAVPGIVIARTTEYLRIGGTQSSHDIVQALARQGKIVLWRQFTVARIR